MVVVEGRPKPLICEGGDLAMTSDDLFSASPPGKTLVVGASYVALECAGATCLLSLVPAQEDVQRCDCRPLLKDDLCPRRSKQT